MLSILSPGESFSCRGPRIKLRVSQAVGHMSPVQSSPLLNVSFPSVSLGGTANASHVTPNTSLGLVQATPSRVLPSPTVNTREALGEHRRLGCFVLLHL